MEYRKQPMLSKLLESYQAVDPLQMRAPDFLKVQFEIERTKQKAILSGSGWKEVDTCPLCGSSNGRIEFNKNHVHYICCQECDIRYASQIAKNLDDVYKNPNYLSYSIDETDEHYNYRRERFGHERVSILEKHCGDLTNKRLLDVGCGNGYFLSVAKEKCNYCFGSEFSKKLREFSHLKTGLPIFSESLDELPENNFDIITLFDVLEHIPNPLTFIRSIDRILDPGGFILIFTPNFDSFSIRVMRQNSSIIDPTEHVVLYTMQSLNFLAKQFSYKVVYSETQGLDIQNILALHHYKGEEKDQFLVQWNNELQSIIDAAQCGDYGRIMFRKPLLG